MAEALRLEVQGFLRQQLPISSPLPLSLPLKDLTELEAAEQILQSEDARHAMVSKCVSFNTHIVHSTQNANLKKKKSFQERLKNRRFCFCNLSMFYANIFLTP